MRVAWLYWVIFEFIEKLNTMNFLIKIAPNFDAYYSMPRTITDYILIWKSFRIGSQVTLFIHSALPFINLYLGRSNFWFGFEFFIITFCSSSTWCITSRKIRFLILNIGFIIHSTNLRRLVKKWFSMILTTLMMDDLMITTIVMAALMINTLVMAALVFNYRMIF